MKICLQKAETFLKMKLWESVYSQHTKSEAWGLYFFFFFFSSLFSLKTKLASYRKKRKELYNFFRSWGSRFSLTLSIGNRIWYTIDPGDIGKLSKHNLHDIEWDPDQLCTLGILTINGPIFLLRSLFRIVGFFNRVQAQRVLILYFCFSFKDNNSLSIYTSFI